MNRLRFLRTQVYRMKQADVAKLVGRTAAWLSMVETGKGVEKPSPEALRVLASFFKVRPPSALLEEVSEKEVEDVQRKWLKALLERADELGIEPPPGLRPRRMKGKKR